MKIRVNQSDGSFVYRTTVSGETDGNDVYIEVFRTKEEMENNSEPVQVLTSFDELLDFNE